MNLTTPKNRKYRVVMRLPYDYPNTLKCRGLGQFVSNDVHHYIHSKGLRQHNKMDAVYAGKQL